MPAQNFEKARWNMVKCQLNTNGVIAPSVLDVFGKTPREAFLPETLAHAAYVDDEVKFPGGVMLEPLVHARMVQALEPAATDNVLVIGDASGYAAAVLAPMVSTVVAVEPSVGAFTRAREAWKKFDFNNIATVPGGIAAGGPEHAPYNLIFVNGAVTELPEDLMKQLAPNGRLVCVIRGKDQPIGLITLSKRQENGVYATRKMFDASAHYVPGFEPKPAFKF